MKIDLKRLISLTLPVLEGFEQNEPRVWDLDAIFLELIAEIGSLGRQITIWEELRHGRKSLHNLADELSDTLFVLIRLAHYLDVNLSPTIKACEPTQPVDRILQLSRESQELWQAIRRSSHHDVISRKIEELITLVAGLSIYYGIRLESAHEEEMKHAALWQQLFLPSPAGSSLIAKLRWKRITIKHIKKLDII